MTGFCYAPKEEKDTDIGGEEQISQMLLDITVNGQSMKALLDTGSSLSLLKSRHVSNVNYASTMAVQCVHGVVKRYPWAEVFVCRTRCTC